MDYKVEAKEKFTVGSRAFFDGIDGFIPHDSDELWILTEPLFGKKKSFIFKNMKEGKDLILYPPFSKQEFLDYDLAKCNGVICDGMKFGKYIIPSFANYIGLTIDDLKSLSEMINVLDEKHLYQKVIYDAYIANNDFTLSDEQRQAAYASYKEARKVK